MTRRKMAVFSNTKTFSPLDIYSLKFWADFSDKTTLFTDSSRTTMVSADGDPIGGIFDKSGQGRHASQTGAARPLYKTNIQYGKSASLYNGTTQFLEINSLSSIFSGNDKPMSLYYVLKQNVLSGIQGVFELGHTVSSAVLACDLVGTTETRVVKRDDAGVAAVTNGGIPIVSNVYSFILSYTGTAINVFYRNSDILSSGITFDVGVATYNTGAIAARNSAGVVSSFLNGYIMELCVFDAALSANETKSILAYSSKKWNNF